MYIYYYFLLKKQSSVFLLMVLNYSVPNKTSVNYSAESNNWFVKTVTMFSSFIAEQYPYKMPSDEYPKWQLVSTN